MSAAEPEIHHLKISNNLVSQKNCTVLNLIVHFPWPGFQASYFCVDTQLKWFRHEKWRTRQRQSVQIIFGSGLGSGMEVWHSRDVPGLCTLLRAPGLAPCCRGVRSRSEGQLTRMENHFPYNPRCLRPLSSPLLMCCLGPQSHLRGGGEGEGRKNKKNSWVTAPVLFHELDNRAETSGFGIFPKPGSACPMCWKRNAIRRVWSSEWSLPKCYCSLNVEGEFYLWMCWKPASGEAHSLSTRYTVT